MRLKVNGKIQTVCEPVPLLEFLAKTGYQLPQIVIELNGKIIPKSEYEKMQLHDDDTVEILTFMGGG